MAVTTIKTHGELSDLTIPEFEAEIKNTREAIELLEANFPHIRSYFLNAHKRGVAFRVVVGSGWELTDDEIYDPTCGQEIHIFPVLLGSGNVFKVILGVALIGLAFTGVGVLGMSPLMTGVMGGLMIFSGLMGGNKPAAPDPNEEDTQSFIFSGAVNTTAVGARIPAAYGFRLFVGSIVISATVRTFGVQD